MFYSGPAADEVTDDHEGYVSGRSRDDSRSNIWTDVSQCAPGTFVSFLPACECGWRGSDRPGDPAGYQACQRAWLDEHFADTVAPQRRSRLGDRFPATLRDADFDWGAGLDRLVNARASAEPGGLPVR